MSSVKMHKGRKFYACPTVVMMPTTFATGARKPYVAEGQENCVVFGRLVSKFAKEIPEGAYITAYSWDADDETKKKAAFATPIKPAGHSLTNLMYGADGYMYLAIDGKVYRAQTPARQAAA